MASVPQRNPHITRDQRLKDGGTRVTNTHTHTHTPAATCHDAIVMNCGPLPANLRCYGSDTLGGWKAYSISHSHNLLKYFQAACPGQYFVMMLVAALGLARSVHE
eukprot:3621513-Amphidinium_carterae.2